MNDTLKDVWLDRIRYNGIDTLVVAMCFKTSTKMASDCKRSIPVVLPLKNVFSG